MAVCTPFGSRATQFWHSSSQTLSSSKGTHRLGEENGETNEGREATEREESWWKLGNEVAEKVVVWSLVNVARGSSTNILSRTNLKI